MDNSRDLDLEKQIDAYIKGHLSADEAEKLWQALLFRPDYIELLETELYIKRIIEEQESADKEGSVPVQPLEKFGSLFKHSWKWMAAAASIALLIISLNFFQGNEEQNLNDLLQGEINMVENLASPEVMRSQDTDTKVSGIDSLLNLGFKAAISGDVEKALGFYNNVIDNYSSAPHVSMAYLNLGIIQYNRENYEEASVAFNNAIQRVQDDRMLKEKAYWYLGNAYINQDRLKEGRKAILSAFNLNGIYKNPAERLLKKIDEKLEVNDSE